MMQLFAEVLGTGGQWW